MENKYNVLFVAEELSTNGAMKSLIALLKVLNPDKYDISLFLFNHNGGQMQAQIPAYIKILPEIPAYKAFRLPLKTALLKYLCKWRLDLVLFRILVAFQRYFKLNFTLWNFLPMLPGKYDIACSYADGFVSPMILKKVSAKKKVCWIHMTYSQCAQAEYVYDALRKCDICVPVSYEAGKDLDKVLGCHTQQHVVHNITDLAECVRLAADECDIPRQEGLSRIVSVGRVSTQKNFDIIPSTAILLKNAGLNFEWIIVGNGDKLEELQRKVEELGLEKLVHLVGEKSNPMPFIKSADVFVNPSRYESWGMTVSEALCLGRVVVASDIPVFAEQIKDGHNGFMREPVPQTMSEIILYILANPEVKKDIEANAKLYPFSKEGVVEEFDELVKRLFPNAVEAI